MQVEGLIDGRRSGASLMVGAVPSLQSISRGSPPPRRVLVQQLTAVSKLPQPMHRHAPLPPPTKNHIPLPSAHPAKYRALPASLVLRSGGRSRGKLVSPIWNGAVSGGAVGGHRQPGSKSSPELLSELRTMGLLDSRVAIRSRTPLATPIPERRLLGRVGSLSDEMRYVDADRLVHQSLSSPSLLLNERNPMRV